MQKISPTPAPNDSHQAAVSETVSTPVTSLYRAVVPCLEASRRRIVQFIWSATCICSPHGSLEGRNAPILPEEAFTDSRKVTDLMTEKALVLDLKEKAHRLLTTNIQDAFSTVIEIARIDYVEAADVFENWLADNRISFFAAYGHTYFSSFFHKIRNILNTYRYVDFSNQKEKIEGTLRTVYPAMASDVSHIIDLVGSLLQELQIGYHNIQHTMEVTLATAQIMQQLFSQKQAQKEHVLFSVVSALFHDIAYSNTEVAHQLIFSLEENLYKPFFLQSKDQAFVDGFQDAVQRIQHGRNATGAEMHLYHVALSQLLLPHFLEKLPNSVGCKQKLLEKRSLDIICSMISLTDIKPDPKEHKRACRKYLQKEGHLIGGESLATSDLLTQIATSDRLEKSLALYYEFDIGKDSSFSHSGLALMSQSCSFYEQVAKNKFDRRAMQALDNYFQTENPYRIGLELELFLHKIFEFLYKKLLNGNLFTHQDMALLKGLEKNGLQEAVVNLFEVMKDTREGTFAKIDSLEKLSHALIPKNSPLEIAVGDEIRITLMAQAALHNDISRIHSLLSGIRKPELLIDRSFDFLFILKQIIPNKAVALEKLVDIVINKIPPNTPGLTQLKQNIALLKESFLVDEGSNSPLNQIQTEIYEPDNT